MAISLRACTNIGSNLVYVMLDLSMALKAIAMGLIVAMYCNVLTNVLRRRIKEPVTACAVRLGRTVFPT